jgi:hypothetical protein
MDPYLEGPRIWEDFHANIATAVRAQLGSHLEPRYYAALTPRVTYEEITVEEVRAMKPDVRVLKVTDKPIRGGTAIIAPAPATALITLELPVKEQSIEIREAGTDLLVTAIEILSPVNKRPGHDAFDAYRRKRRDVFRSRVHLMEIDLLRAGQRPPFATPIPPAPYYVTPSRAEKRPKVEVWPLQFPEPIPVVPVPLLAPDPDAPFDLGRAIQIVYAGGRYHLRIDYFQLPPKPELPAETVAWLRERRQRT